MKKILNNPLDYANETLEGLCAAHPRYYKRIGAEGRVMVRPDAPIKGKVGIVTGGGSGHLPVFTGYLGPGLLDACAIGDVFASPGVDLMADAIRAANGGGTKITDALTPSCATASATELKTGIFSCVVPPLPGVTPATTLVP